MPSTSVAQRKAAWKRIAHKYRKHDAAKTTRREQEKIAKLKLMAQRKSASSKK